MFIKLQSLSLCLSVIYSILAAAPTIQAKDNTKLCHSCAHGPQKLPLDLPNNPQIHTLAVTLIQAWEAYGSRENPSFEQNKLLLALEYANKMHAGQTRRDLAATPYIIHPLQVCSNLWHIGQVRNANILMAALLHDTLEDTKATAEELEKLFGTRVCITVQEVTNDPALNSEQNKQRQIDHISFMSQDARLVKLADRLANIADLSQSTPNWLPEKIERYFEWGSKLLFGLQGTNTALEKALSQALTKKQTIKLTKP